MNKYIVGLLLISRFALANDALPGYDELKLGQCNNALKACGVLVQEQDLSIRELKGQVSTLENSLADAQSGPIFPFWFWIAIGAVSGAATVRILTTH